MTYEPGSYLKELAVEHEAGDHVREGKLLDALCPLCTRLSDQLTDEHVEKGHAEPKEHCVYCWKDPREGQES